LPCPDVQLAVILKVRLDDMSQLACTAHPSRLLSSD
jgi:hypothetical protein